MNEKTMKYSKQEIHDALTFAGLNLKTFSAKHGFNYKTVRDYMMIYPETGKPIRGKIATEIMDLLEYHVKNLQKARIFLQSQER